jgi:hypothetical protein
MEPLITAADMEKMTPQQRADAVDRSIVTSWDEVPEPFRTRVFTKVATIARRFEQGE